MRISKKPITLILLAFLFLALFSTLPFTLIRNVEATTIFTDDFETGDISKWTNYNEGTGDDVNTTSKSVISGSYSLNSTLNATLTQSAYVYNSSIPLQTASSYYQFDFNVSSVPESGQTMSIATMKQSSNTDMWCWIKNSSSVGAWSIAGWNDTSQETVINASNPIVLKQVYNVELGWHRHATEGFARLWVDGVLVCSLNNMNTTRYTGVDRIELGLTSSLEQACTAIYDNVILADAYIGVSSTGLTYEVVGFSSATNGSSSVLRVRWNSTGSFYIIGHNNTGTFTNASALACSSTWTNSSSITINSTATHLQWQAWINSTTGSWFNIPLQTVTLTNLYSVGAETGDTEKVQYAVNNVNSIGGGIVYLPEGNFSFNVNASRIGVNNRPCALRTYGNISIFGAGLDKTLLNQTEEADYDGAYLIVIDGNNEQPIEFKDFSIHGFVLNETHDIVGIGVYGVKNFQIHNMNFTDFNGSGVMTSRNYRKTNPHRGVIYECNFDNPYKDDPNAEGDGANGRMLWGYGVNVQGTGTNWEDNIDNLRGNYRNDTIYVEDCNFTRMRHAVASNSGGYYVVRFCSFYNPRPEQFQMLDVHGSSGAEPLVGGMGAEIYNNTFLGCEYCWTGTEQAPTGEWYSKAIELRGGKSLVFNNSIVDCATGVSLTTDAVQEKCNLTDTYLWDNTLTNVSKPNGAGTYIVTTYFTEGVEYFLYAKTGYIPYTYPHPFRGSAGSGEDLPPSWYIYGSNTTLHGASCLLYASFEDDNGLSHWKAENNNTGTLTNTTNAFSSNPDWANHTITLNATIGVVVAWRIHANDSIDQCVVFSWQYITVTSEPLYGSVSHDNVVKNKATTFTCAWVSSYTLRFGILSHNNSGSWQNRSAKALSGLSDSLSDSFTLIDDINIVVGYKFYANDSQGLWNNTGIYTLTTIESQASTGGLGQSGNLIMRFIVYVANKPMKGVTVRIYESAYDTYVCSATTETDGSIDVNLPTGEYHYIASYEGATVEGDFFHIESQTTKIKFGSDGGRLPLTVDAKLLFVMVVLVAVVCGAGFGIMKASKMR